MNAITKHEGGLPSLAMDEGELLAVLQSSLYPGADLRSITMVLGYCKAAGLDPMLKPVHIVQMWDKPTGKMRDIVMPGIGLYRTQAARSGAYAGISEPEFGPEVTKKIGGIDVTYPEWCKVTARRLLPNGGLAEFTAVERWMENYAVKGGKERSIAPNAMWMRRPYGQLAKCAQAQALRTAFPELGSAPTADEMEGKMLEADYAEPEKSLMPRARSEAEPEATGWEVVDEVEKPEPKAAPAKPVVPEKPATNGKPATVGEKAYCRNKLGDRLDEACEANGIAAFDNLTADEFLALRQWIKEHA